MDLDELIAELGQQIARDGQHAYQGAASLEMYRSIFNIAAVDGIFVPSRRLHALVLAAHPEIGANPDTQAAIQDLLAHWDQWNRKTGYPTDDQARETAGAEDESTGSDADDALGPNGDPTKRGGTQGA